ncbi:toll/interleukin-1 receptor domain-containing protein [uncultured Hymenobacter sp.]|uniref:toll/interleukin-1 receptor domain-containing protein n=1 Tax=uncultured Hymenobacter sp. TaxID=170016 RepID=UPI0035CA98D8
MRIFLSHSSRDAQLVSRLRKQLQNSRHDIISTIQDVLPGQDWTSEIKNLLESADILIPVITEQSNKSSWII